MILEISARLSNSPWVEGVPWKDPSDFGDEMWVATPMKQTGAIEALCSPEN
jgi:hypothetical protein